MFWKDPSFVELKKKWYEKLKKSGFEEIEDLNGPKDFLIHYDSSRFFKDYSAEYIDEHQTYYRMCDDFFWNYAAWKSPPEKEIWRLHSMGYSRRKIAFILQRQKFQISSSSVQIILSRLKKIMQTQTWPRSEGEPSGSRKHQRDIDRSSELHPDIR